MSTGEPASHTPSASHWGAFSVTAANGDIAAVTPWAGDEAPSPLLGNLPGSVTHRARVARPAVRRGWWEHGPGPSTSRGSDEFVQPPWDEVLDALAAELRRVIDTHGNASIYGGSYGWASAGRFHHAQSQLHRFLNTLGGYTGSINTYSTGAAEVILPRVIADEQVLTQHATTWDVLIEHTRLFVCFGGIPTKNTGTDSGGPSAHPVPAALAAMRERGCRFVSVSALRDDLVVGGQATRAGAGESLRWLPARPGSDVSLLLALCHTLLVDGLVDTSSSGFVRTHCVGFEAFADYLLGRADGVPKSAAWAAPLTGLSEVTIVEVARAMAATRTMVTVTWSLQRTRYGEQVVWAAVALAALLGQIGLPGGGFSSGYGSMNKPGLSPTGFRLPSLPQGANPIRPLIPVAQVSDLLLRPGETIPYDGGFVTFPDIRLVYWAGGNPFHHHQNLARLRSAFARPDTIVVHDPYWTPTARHADIVLPSTTAYERDDLSGTRAGARLLAQRAAVPAFASSRDDYTTYSLLAERLGTREAFTRGRDARAWIDHLYESWRTDVTAGRLSPPGSVLPAGLPDAAGFWEAGAIDLPRSGPVVAFEAFRADPIRHRLTTPSGRIELFSATIAALGLPDCPGHPTWLEPVEWWRSARAARFPLHLLANQPRTRLHSQLDLGATSQASKVAGREPMRLHPSDAAARGLLAGDVVRVFNDRGACLAGVVVDDGILPGVVQLSTGAWYDPVDPTDVTSLCVHGNPNVLTEDVGTSGLAQGCTGAHVLVEVEAYRGVVPPVRAFDPPTFVELP